jgi:hypothetical protein
MGGRAHNSKFALDRQPLRNHPFLDHEKYAPTGPFSFLNPTVQKLARRHEPGQTDEKEDFVPADSVDFRWTSRNNRKGRHQLEYTPPKNAEDAKHAAFMVPESTSSPLEILKVVWKMLVCYPVFDLSWWIAYLFLWGSIVWVINAL